MLFGHRHIGPVTSDLQHNISLGSPMTLFGSIHKSSLLLAIGFSSGPVTGPPHDGDSGTHGEGDGRKGVSTGNRGTSTGECLGIGRKRSNHCSPVTSTTEPRLGPRFGVTHSVSFVFSRRRETRVPDGPLIPGVPTDSPTGSRNLVL